MVAIVVDPALTTRHSDDSLAGSNEDPGPALVYCDTHIVLYTPVYLPHFLALFQGLKLALPIVGLLNT